MNLETYTTIGGKVITIPECERERIRKENQKAAQALNPARPYMKVWEAAHGTAYAEAGPKNPAPWREEAYHRQMGTRRDHDAPQFWKKEQAMRETRIRAILASSPENMASL